MVGHWLVVSFFFAPCDMLIICTHFFSFVVDSVRASKSMSTLIPKSHHPHYSLSFPHPHGSFLFVSWQQTPPRGRQAPGGSNQNHNRTGEPPPPPPSIQAPSPPYPPPPCASVRVRLAPSQPTLPPRLSTSPHPGTSPPPLPFREELLPAVR